MIGTTRQVRVWAYGSPVDLRKGFDGLAALVGGDLGQDPLSGDLFLFVNRSRHLAKVLLWDGTGLCIYSKRLEQGRFACLWRALGRARLGLTMSELQLFLEGSTLVGKVELSPPAFARKHLAFEASLSWNSMRDPDRDRAKHRGATAGGSAAVARERGSSRTPAQADG